MDYLTIDEVVQILKAHPNTIYKMCREGTLPAVKIGKEWRIDRKKLAKFMEGGTPPTKAGEFEGLVRLALQPGHFLGLFSNENDIQDFELTYLLEAKKSGYRLFKECWWQHPDDVRRHLAEAGLPVEAMEYDGSLVMLDFNEIFVIHGADKASEAWYSTAERAMKLGFKGLVSAGAKHFDCCANHHSLLAFENAIQKTAKAIPISAICSYRMDLNVNDVITRLVDLILVHDRFFIQTENTEVLAQVNYSITHPGRKIESRISSR